MEEEKEKRTDESTTDTPIQASYSNSIISQVEAEIEAEINQTGFKLLGHTKDAKYVFYKDNEIYPISIKQLDTDLIQMYFGVDEQTAKRWKKSLPRLSSYRTIDTNKTINNGIFSFKEDSLDNGKHQAFTIINGLSSFKVFYYLAGYKIEPITEPIIHGQLIDLETNETWLDVDEFKHVLGIDEGDKGNKESGKGEEGTKSSIEILTEQFNEIARTLDAWQFEDVDMLLYLTAFIMLAPFHLLMDWRPYIWITGNKGTGKTLLFERVLQQIYGDLVVRLDNSTEYAVAQTLSGTGLIPLFDNFEPSERAQKVVSLFEMAGRGGEIRRGRPDDKALHLHLNHLPWYNSVIVTPETAATDSRIVEFRLKAPPSKLPKLSEEVSAPKIIAGIISNWEHLQDLKNEFIEHNKDNGRAAENVAYAHALIQILEEFKQPDEKIGSEEQLKLPDFVAYRPQVDEGIDLLNTILKFSVLPDNATDRDEATKKFVYEALTEDGNSIKRKGVWIVGKQDGKKYIAIDEGLVVEEILRNTRFRNYTPKAVRSKLRNVKGVIEDKQRRLNKGPIMTLLIPIEYLDIVEVNPQDDDSQENDENDEAPF